MKELCEVCGCDRSLDNEINCPMCGNKPKNDILNIYIHTGNGHWIGSCVVVSAYNMKEAEIMIRASLNKMGLKKEELDIKEEKGALTTHSVIYLNNGDY